MTEPKKATGLDLMRQPFPANQISKLPKPTKAQTDAVKADFKAGVRCTICGGWHHPKVVHLDYVGHAALTDRLLDCDPAWNWEPLALSPHGTPVIDGNGGLWIKLTASGVTRLGYGHADGKQGGDAVKEAIGDAMRNAAMRFGAALDLWHKGDLHVDEAEDDDGNAATKTRKETAGDDSPPFDHAAARDRIKEAIGRAETVDDLADAWKDNADTIMQLKAEKPAMFAQLNAAKNDRKKALTEDPPPDDGGVPF